MSLLARAYLYKGDNVNALKMAEAAIEGAEANKWALWSNKEYATAWSNDASAAAPGEILFEMVINTPESQGKETMGRLNSKDGYDDMCITVSFYHLLKEDPDITKSAGERPIGGLGIFMVKKLMDEIQYDFRDGKNILTIIKKV